MKRIILIKSVTIFLIIILATSGCYGTKDPENYKFVEKVIHSKVIDVNFGDGTINMYLDENGDIQLNKTEKFPAYIDNAKKILFIMPDIHDVTNSTILAISNSSNVLFMFSLNELPYIENVEFGTEPCYGGRIFQMDNGNLALFLDYLYYQKLIEININTMEILNSVDFTEIKDFRHTYSLKEITDTQTLFYNPGKGEILLYNNTTGVQEGKTIAPGYDNDQTKDFKMGKTIKYGDYWYTITESGIYKAKKNTFEWECLVPEEETTCIKHEDLVFWDLLIKSDDEIYAIIRSGFQEIGDDQCVETFVEFEIK